MDVGADAFERFVRDARPRLARAFIATYGPDRGEEALAEAMVFAWEQFEAVSLMDNPVGFLFRVGQSKTRERLRPPAFPSPAALGLPGVEPGLPAALAALTESQRACVVLVHAYGWRHQEVADLLELSRSTVQNHVERGLAHLRRAIGVGTDA